MRLASLVALVVLLCAFPDALAVAATASTQDESSGTITAVAAMSPVAGVRGGSGARCSWVPMYFTRDPASDEFTEGDIGFTPIDQNPAATRSFGDVEHRLYRVVCPGLPDQQRWVRTGVTAADLIPGVVDVVEGQLQLPVPDVNPAPVNGGIVNVGLWLAVEDQVMAPVSAQAGPNAWITVSPRLASTRYGFGNGDAIDCEGTGVPIRDVHPDLDVLEQSPTCGYTYRTSSPDDDPYRLTVTTVWVLPYTSSQGGGVLTPLERSVTVDYDVDEIQTVGIAN